MTKVAEEQFNFGQTLADSLGIISNTDPNLVKEPVSIHDFIFKYCYTLDPHDKRNPIKLMPQKKHLEVLIDQWVKDEWVLVVKSRQMMVSWLMCAIHLWDCMYHPGRLSFFVSKKEDDANFSRELSLLSRVRFMYDRLPEELKVKCKIKQKPACFEFPGIHSSIYGVSQDSEALRMYTATTVFWDEMAFHEHARQAYMAVKPTLSGGGSLCGVSTPNGKFNLFYDLVHDTKRKKIKNKTNLVEVVGQETPLEQRSLVKLIPGMQAYKNVNGYTITRLHYSSDVTKGEEWVKKEKAGCATEEEWNQEMELSFTATSSLRVYPEFTIDRNTGDLKHCGHVGSEPIWRGWDFGYHRPFCCWAQPQKEGSLFVFGELMGEDTVIEDFAKEVIRLSNKAFPGCKFKDAGDPAVAQKTDKSKRTTADILRGLGIRIQYRPTRVHDGIHLIRAMLHPTPKGFVRLKINASCETIIDAMLGGYGRKEGHDDEPEKDFYYDHAMDALRYLVVILHDVRSGDRYKKRFSFTRSRPTANPVTGY